MKKISLIVTLLLVVSLLSACDTKNSLDTSATTETTVETTEKEIKIGITKTTLAEPDSFIQSMKDYGAEVSDMDDAEGYWFTFSASEHKRLLEDKHAETVKKFKEYEENSEHYIDKIEYDEDFRNLIFNVNKDLYATSANGTSDIVIAASALSYQLYLEDGQRTFVKVIYSGTEEVVSSFSLPMNLSLEQ